ncbi:Hypothetical predicted protein [Marmota monax]|uniref:Uncharacterized protein n=1 Tax=Marmota monax TaxID=9995 RepID=A0A5E4BQT7_MARMO|nr:Hypothetical predicted protein [Marmota monax]
MSTNVDELRRILYVFVGVRCTCPSSYGPKVITEGMISSTDRSKPGTQEETVGDTITKLHPSV